MATAPKLSERFAPFQETLETVVKTKTTDLDQDDMLLYEASNYILSTLVAEINEVLSKVHSPAIPISRPTPHTLVRSYG